MKYYKDFSRADSLDLKIFIESEIIPAAIQGEVFRTSRVIMNYCGQEHVAGDSMCRIVCDHMRKAGFVQTRKRHGKKFYQVWKLPDDKRADRKVRWTDEDMKPLLERLILPRMKAGEEFETRDILKICGAWDGTKENYNYKAIAKMCRLMKHYGGKRRKKRIKRAVVLVWTFTPRPRIRT